MEDKHSFEQGKTEVSQRPPGSRTCSEDGTCSVEDMDSEEGTGSEEGCWGRRHQTDVKEQ